MDLDTFGKSNVIKMLQYLLMSICKD